MLSEQTGDSARFKDLQRLGHLVNREPMATLFFKGSTGAAGERLNCYGRVLLYLSLSLIPLSRLGAAEVVLDDHSSAACWQSQPDRADWATMHVTVVTGNVWQHDDTNGFNPLAYRGPAGSEQLIQFYVPFGTPAGTVITEFDYFHPYPLCAVMAGDTHVFGFATEVYELATGFRRGDVVASGLVINYTNTQDGGSTGNMLGREKIRLRKSGLSTTVRRFFCPGRI